MLESLPEDVGTRLRRDAAVLADLAAAVEDARGSGRAVDAGNGVWVAAALAGAEHLGSVVIRDVPAPLDLSARRTLERGAMVTALVLTFNRSVADAEEAFVSRSALRRMVTEEEVGAAVVAMLAMPGMCGADVDLSAGMIA